MSSAARLALPLVLLLAFAGCSAHEKRPAGSARVPDVPLPFDPFTHVAKEGQGNYADFASVGSGTVDGDGFSINDLVRICIHPDGRKIFIAAETTKPKSPLSVAGDSFTGLFIKPQSVGEYLAILLFTNPAIPVSVTGSETATVHVGGRKVDATKFTFSVQVGTLFEGGAVYMTPEVPGVGVARIELRAAGNALHDGRQRELAFSEVWTLTDFGPDLVGKHE
jgi:hypothetical protein